MHHLQLTDDISKVATRAIMDDFRCEKSAYGRCDAHGGARWNLTDDVCSEAQGNADLAVEAVLPALERQIRERVAESIRANKILNPVLLLEGARNAGMDYAAKIAQGKEEA